VTDTERKMRVLVLDDDVEVGELVGELASMAGLAPVGGELRLGVVAALIGAPVFMWIALRRRTGHD